MNTPTTHTTADNTAKPIARRPMQGAWVRSDGSPSATVRTGRERRALALAFVRDQIRVNCTSPTYDEIATHIGLKAKSTLRDLLRSLVESNHLIEIRLSGGRRFTTPEVAEAIKSVEYKN